MQEILSGAIAAGWAVTALFFLRFWRQTRDRFFLYFTVSFTLEAIDRVAIGLHGMQEDHPLFYSVRIVAYGLILLAIWQKNRPRR